MDPNYISRTLRDAAEWIDAEASPRIRWYSVFSRTAGRFNIKAERYNEAPGVINFWIGDNRVAALDAPDIAAIVLVDNLAIPAV